MNKAELIKALAELLAEKMEIGEEPTNGEVIRALFPNINEYNFNSTWWNAPYQKGGEE